MKNKKWEIIRLLCGMMIAMIAGAMGMGKFIGSRFVGKSTMSNKYLELFLMMNQWVKVKQSNKNLSAYFERVGYKRIAIYGMSAAGMTLLDELKETEVQVVYGIDKRADEVYADLDIVTMEEDLDVVDAIVVTAISFFDEIKEELGMKVDCPVISLNDILYEV